ncbi:reverse transcriptase [Gossypium australe]|uniref:Reverse transcriptase n=1 Tax=Gossypium australe TaxID=47621 RepID=A0A5B6WGN1_9ROSI|nr:reverse transcriptase [Gossypium australe]
MDIIVQVESRRWIKIPRLGSIGETSVEANNETRLFTGSCYESLVLSNEWFYESKAWYSILSTCRAIEEGGEWKVGSGALINIWRDPWLSGPRQARVMGQCININYSYVSNLIDVDSYTWKVDVLNRLFDNDQVMRILSILMSRFALKDEFVWQ